MLLYRDTSHKYITNPIKISQNVNVYNIKQKQNPRVREYDVIWGEYVKEHIVRDVFTSLRELHLCLNIRVTQYIGYIFMYLYICRCIYTYVDALVYMHTYTYTHTCFIYNNISKPLPYYGNIKFTKMNRKYKRKSVEKMQWKCRRHSLFFSNCTCFHVFISNALNAFLWGSFFFIQNCSHLVSRLFQHVLCSTCLLLPFLLETCAYTKYKK